MYLGIISIWFQWGKIGREFLKDNPETAWQASNQKQTTANATNSSLYLTICTFSSSFTFIWNCRVHLERICPETEQLSNYDSLNLLQILERNGWIIFVIWIPSQAARECTMPCYGEKLDEAVQNLRIKLYVMSFDSVQIHSWFKLLLRSQQSGDEDRSQHRSTQVKSNIYN